MRQFKLPEKDMLHIEIRKGRTGKRIGGEFKDAVYEALSQKKVVRARTLFNTEKANYQVLMYEKHGDSANVSIMRIRRQDAKKN